MEINRRKLLQGGAMAGGALLVPAAFRGGEGLIDAIGESPETRIETHIPRFQQLASVLKRNDEAWDRNIAAHLPNHPALNDLETSSVHRFLYSYFMETEVVDGSKQPSIPGSVRQHLARIIPGLVAQESEFDNTVVRTEEEDPASGLFQIKPSTAQDFGYHWGGHPERRNYQHLPIAAELAFINFERMYRHLQGRAQLDQKLDQKSNLSGTEKDKFVALCLGGAHNSGEGNMGGGENVDGLLNVFFNQDRGADSALELYAQMMDGGMAEYRPWQEDDQFHKFVFQSLAGSYFLDKDYEFEQDSVGIGDVLLTTSLGVAGAIGAEAAATTYLDRNKRGQEFSGKQTYKNTLDRGKDLIEGGQRVAADPKNISRRDALRGAAATSILVGSGVAGGLTQSAFLGSDLSVERRRLENPYNVRNSFLYLTANEDQSMLEMVETIGLEQPLALGQFQSANASILGENKELMPGVEYRMPVYALTVSESSTLWQTLSEAGVAQFLNQVHAFNQAYNPEYNVADPRQIYPGQMVLIPQWGTGFYSSTDENQALPLPEVITDSGSINPNRDVQLPEITDLSAGTGIPYAQLKTAIENSEKLSEDLTGYTFILDPGHGGRDPGAVRDENQETELIEAALTYDCSLRVMRYLMMHGADVYLTHLNEEVGIQDVTEFDRDYSDNVYNIVGGDVQPRALGTRQAVARRIMEEHQSNPVQKNIFLSIHIDSLPAQMDPGITFYIDRDRKIPGYDQVNRDNKNFAESLMRHIPRSQFKQRGGLGVLAQNPAHRELLVEFANLNNASGAARVRDPQNREQLAQLLGNSLRESLS